MTGSLFLPRWAPGAPRIGCARHKMRHVPRDRAFDERSIEAGGSPLVLDARQHALDQIVVVLVPIGLEVEIGRHLGQPLVADVLDIFLHEPVVVVPADAGGAHRRLLGRDAI